MPRKESTPATRRADTKKRTNTVRKQFKVRTHVKLLPSEVPHVEQMVVVLKLANYSRVQIAKIIGISRDQVNDMLDKPKVNEEIAILRKKLPAAALELLQDFMIEAVMVIAEVMRTEEDGKLRLQAAESLLDRGGVVKVSKQERLQVNEDKTTITDDGIVERLRQAPPEVQEEAAQIIERLEEILADSAAEVSVEGSDDE